MGTNLPPELAGQLNKPFTAQITDGRVEINKIEFKVGDTKVDYTQWRGTLVTDSMKGMTEEHVIRTTYNGIERVDTGWVGEFDLHQVW